MLLKPLDYGVSMAMLLQVTKMSWIFLGPLSYKVEWAQQQSLYNGGSKPPVQLTPVASPADWREQYAGLVHGKVSSLVCYGHKMDYCHKIPPSGIVLKDSVGGNPSSRQNFEQ